MMAALVQIAREQVRGKLHAEMGEGAGSLIDAAVARAASGQEEFGQGVALGDLERAASAIAQRAASGEIGEETIAGWIREGRVEDALAALGHLAQVPLAMVARAYHAPDR